MNGRIHKTEGPDAQFEMKVMDGFTTLEEIYTDPFLYLSYFVKGQHHTSVSIPLARTDAATLRQMADDLEAAWALQDAARLGAA